MIDNCRHLGASRDPNKILLVDVSPFMSFLQIFDKQYILPLSAQERHCVVRVCFYITQEANKIPLRIGVSMCKTKQKRLAWRPWEQSRLKQESLEAEL